MLITEIVIVVLRNGDSWKLTENTNVIMHQEDTQGRSNSLGWSILGRGFDNLPFSRYTMGTIQTN